MDSTSTTVTLEEFLDTPEPEDGSTLEFWDGEVVSMPPGGPSHGVTAGYIVTRLNSFSLARGLGPAFGNDAAYRFDNSVVGPDVSWVHPARYQSIPDTRFELAPDLAVEVVSPNDLDFRVSAKVQRYLDGGVRRVWVVRPSIRTVTVRTSAGAISELRGDQVLESEDAGFPEPGFSLRVADIFELKPFS